MGTENVEPTPIYNDLTGNGAPQAQHAAQDKAWWQKFLNPTFRRWAYGVTAAAVTVYATVTGKPELIPVVAPLLLALFFVDSNGEPKN